MYASLFIWLIHKKNFNGGGVLFMKIRYALPDKMSNKNKRNEDKYKCI